MRVFLPFRHVGRVDVVKMDDGDDDGRISWVCWVECCIPLVVSERGLKFFQIAEGNNAMVRREFLALCSNIFIFLSRSLEVVLCLVGLVVHVGQMFKVHITLFVCTYIVGDCRCWRCRFICVLQWSYYCD